MTTKESLKVIGEELLRNCPETVRRPVGGPWGRDVFCMDTEAFTRDYLHLNRKVARLSTDGSIIGAAVFDHYQNVPVYTMAGEVFMITPMSNTVIIDHVACTQQLLPVPESRFRFTEMHEDCHHILARMGYMEPQPVMYRKTDREESREERMADYLAAYLLMPDSVLIAMMQNRNYEPLRAYEDLMTVSDSMFFDNMARALQVSGAALTRRLRDAGFWEDRSIYEFHDPERHPSFDPIGGLMP